MTRKSKIDSLATVTLNEKGKRHYNVKMNCFMAISDAKLTKQMSKAGAMKNHMKLFSYEIQQLQKYLICNWTAIYVIREEIFKAISD